MNLRFIVSLMVFLASYLPLSAILLVQDFRFDLIGSPLCVLGSSPAEECISPLRNPGYSISIFAICLVCFATSLAVLGLSRGKRSINVTAAKFVPAELINYSIPYVVAFMSIGYDETGKFIGLLIFLGWMFWLSHMSGQIVLNPVLIAFGWRFYEIQYRYPGHSKDHSGVALSKDRVTGDSRWQYTTIQEVQILRRPVEEKSHGSS